MGTVLGTSLVHRWCAIALLALGLAAWSVQLGGVASLQAACARTAPDDAQGAGGAAASGKQLQDLLVQTAQLLQGRGDKLPSSTVSQALSAHTQALQLLTSHADHQAASSSHTECMAMYRYQWLNVGLQLLALCLAWHSLFSGQVQQGRLGVCCLLVVATLLAIENAHTIFHARDNDQHVALAAVEARLFFAGCVVTSCADVLLLFVLGREERPMVGGEEWHYLQSVHRAGPLGRSTSRKGDV